MGLADQVIQANEDERIEQELIDKRSGDTAPEGYYTDDLGLWVEQDIRRKKVKFAEYVLFRCQRLGKKTLMKTDHALYHERRMVSPVPRQIAYIADLPESIPTATAVWVYKRLFEWAPKLNEKKIIVCPGLMWDYEKGELIEVIDKRKKL